MILGRKSVIFPILLAAVVLTALELYRFSHAKPIPCANTISCEASTKLVIDNTDQAVFAGEKIDPPKVVLTDEPKEVKVLGTETDNSQKRIEVDLTTQTLKAYDGDTLFLQAAVSSGKWYPTPTGEYTIWGKVRATLMSGGQGADYYYLPNVPYAMFFSSREVAASRGFSLHGAYWHNNFGHAMSHGCVNMREVDAEKLYYWVSPPTVAGGYSLATKNNPGTKVIIYGKAL